MRRRARPLLGTLVEVTVAEAGAHAAADTAIAAAFDAVERVHKLMSFHDAASDISRFNRAAAGTQVPVDAHTWRVLALALRVQEASAGAFNIACAPRLVEWNCLPAPAPAPATFDASRPVFTLDEVGSVRKISEGWIDVGGIAKGYAVDLAVQALEEAGIASGCVNAGGDLRAFGAHAFAVQVRDPRAPGRAGLQLEVRNEALATSASYFSARQAGAQRVSALVDGRSGAALDLPCSVTVIAPGCALADALTKPVLATGDSAHPALAAFGARAHIIAR
ncbi:MAG: FAD:protein FMN transferase [Telluria sp.]